MQSHEYKVVPAPRRGEKAKGAKSVPDRFGVALAHVMNDLARDGWEYLRAETLPCDERLGFTGTATHFHHMLVFRRPLAVAAVAAPAVPAAPLIRAASTEAATAPIPEPLPDATVIAALKPHAAEGAAPALGPAPVEDFRAAGKR